MPGFVLEPWPSRLSGVLIGLANPLLALPAGWAVRDACSTPIYAQIGGGAWIATFTLGGVFPYALLKPALPH